MFISISHTSILLNALHLRKEDKIQANKKYQKSYYLFSQIELNYCIWVVYIYLILILSSYILVCFMICFSLDFERQPWLVSQFKIVKGPKCIINIPTHNSFLLLKVKLKWKSQFLEMQNNSINLYAWLILNVLMNSFWLPVHESSTAHVVTLFR